MEQRKNNESFATLGFREIWNALQKENILVFILVLSVITFTDHVANSIQPELMSRLFDALVSTAIATAVVIIARRLGRETGHSSSILSLVQWNLGLFVMLGAWFAASRMICALHLQEAQMCRWLDALGGKGWISVLHRNIIPAYSAGIWEEAAFRGLWLGGVRDRGKLRIMVEVMLSSVVFMAF